MKLKKEEVYINLQGKSKEELTDLWEFLDSIGEKHFRDSLNDFLNNYKGWFAYEFHKNTWTLSSDINSLYDKTEVTIEQLKEILQPMEEFKPIAMKYTKEQFDAIKSKLENCEIELIDYDFTYCNYLVNNLNGKTKIVSNVSYLTKENYNREVHEEWNEEIFLKSCGIEVETLQEKEFDLSMCRIIVDNAEQSKKIQELAFKQGYTWRDYGEIVTKTHARVLYFDSKDYIITFSNLDIDDSRYKTFHFTDVFKESLEQQLQKVEAEVKRLRSLIEDNKPKVGDWAMLWEDDEETPVFGLITDVTDYFLTCNSSWESGRKITDQELINKLNELIK